MFALTDQEIHASALSVGFAGNSAGAVVTFEGRVRDHNLGKSVVGLEYEAYSELAISEGNSIILEAKSKFAIIEAVAVHRYGQLGLKDIAVCIVVFSAHRDAAFLACRYIIDEIKTRLPIWKREHYASADAQWVDCPGCKSARHAGGTSEAHRWL